MKFSDINENLTEGPLSGPAGFGARAKAKLQKQIPFAKEQQRRGAVKDAEHDQARTIKNDFKAWKAKAFPNGEKEPLQMGQFIEWSKKYNGKLGAAIEQTATTDKDYAAFAGKTDPKVNVRDTGEDPDATGENPDATGDRSKKVNAPDDDGGLELEQELELADESVEEDANDAEPKVDMSASIYESRLRAFLNEDQEGKIIWNSKILHDNQIDTLIVKGLQRLAQGGASADSSAKKEPSDEISQTADKISNAKSDDSDEYTAAGRGDSSVLDEYADELESILTAVANGKEISNNQQGYARAILDEL